MKQERMQQDTTVRFLRQEQSTGDYDGMSSARVVPSSKRGRQLKSKFKKILKSYIIDSSILSCNLLL